MLLHSERKVEAADGLLELADRNDVLRGIERIIEALEAVKEGDFTLDEQLNNFGD